MPTPLPPFSTWLNRFFTAYYDHRPVNATFIGVHDHDHRLPDFSENGAGDSLAAMQHMLLASQQLEQAPLSPVERIDLRVAQGFLKIQIWEYQSGHFQRGNPSLYTGEAVFGVMALFLTAYAPLTERVEAATVRMEAIPTLLHQGCVNVTRAPLAWTERALQECKGALAFFTEGIDQLIAAEQIVSSAFKAAANKAAAAFASFQSYLTTDLRARPSDPYACGDEALMLYLREGHFLHTEAEDIVHYAEVEMDKAARYLIDHAADFGATHPQDALARLTATHPTVDHYYEHYQALWNQVRQTAEAQDLLTWPDFPLRYVPRPVWTRKAAPHLYFLYYRSPAAFNRPPVHDYLVTPIDRTMPEEEQQRLLRATNESVIKLNHVIHHGSIGHHVQNWHAFHAASRIGQMAAVDCASRIAMFCGGTMAEGWACYATDLMNEAGLLTPLEQYAEKQSRKRMCARAVVDVRLHQGRFSLEQAAAYYEQHAGMGREAALREAVKNSMFPGTALMYLIGTDGIHQLREAMTTRQGHRFSLRNFHDAFLSYGSLPVSLISADMQTKEDYAQR